MGSSACMGKIFISSPKKISSHVPVSYSIAPGRGGEEFLLVIKRAVREAGHTLDPLLSLR